MAKRRKVRKMKTYIEGLEEVKQLLQDMGDAAQGILDQASKRGAELVLAEAKKNVPVDTGRLRDSLFVKKSKVKNGQVKSEYTVTKQSDVTYFAPVELGTSKMKARPFLRPAVDQNLKAIAKTVQDDVLEALGRVT